MADVGIRISSIRKEISDLISFFHAANAIRHPKFLPRNLFGINFSHRLLFAILNEYFPASMGASGD